MLKVSPIAQVPGFTQKFGTGSGRNNARGRSRGNPMENLATSNSARLTGLKVLVIDDSKTIRRTAETLLAKEGCEVFTAVDGFDALSKIADHQPDIVFVDIMMPRLDGYQTCSLIKHNKVFRSIPVIMLSSKDGLFDRARGRIVGSEHYLTKPFTKDELLNAIETHVGQPAR
jgi:twitching motility two-component system response regulator PilG